MVLSSEARPRPILAPDFSEGKQQASRDFDQLTALARDLILRLKNTIRARYGNSAEKLAEFGLNPRRSVRGPRSKKEDVKKPPEAGPTQPQPAPSETDGAIQK